MAKLISNYFFVFCFALNQFLARMFLDMTNVNTSNYLFNINYMVMKFCGEILTKKCFNFAIILFNTKRQHYPCNMCECKVKNDFYIKK